MHTSAVSNLDLVAVMVRVVSPVVPEKIELQRYPQGVLGTWDVSGATW